MNPFDAIFVFFIFVCVIFGKKIYILLLINLLIATNTHNTQ